MSTFFFEYFVNELATGDKCVLAVHVCVALLCFVKNNVFNGPVRHSL